MPRELRDRLTAAAASTGWSLNREIVHRLEQSLEEPAGDRREKGETVKRFQSRRPLVAIALVVLAAAGLAAFGAVQHQGKLSHQPRYLKSDPDARTVVGKSHNLGSPTSAENQQIAALAYPSSSLTAAVLANERSYYQNNVAGRSKANGTGWNLVGPATATVPAVLNVFDDQASDFGVSGRVTAIAVDPACNLSTCRVWMAAAGGGIWRSDNALASDPRWTFFSDGFGTNAIGTLVYDAKSKTLYAGTGEPNSSGDSEAGVGIYASHDSGNQWTLLPGSPAAMNARSISSIIIDPNNPNTMYVGTTRGVRGVSSVTGGSVSLAPDAAAWGLWKTTDGGQTFNFVWDGHASARGVNHVEMDSHGTIYAAAYQQGIWRSKNGGSTWEQVFATQDPTENTARSEFALNTTAGGHTRIYVGDGGTETDGAFPPHSNTGVYRADSIDTKTSAQLTNGTTNPGFVALTSASRADPTYDYCETQCWYDNYVVSPAGHPDMVYIGGSFDYNLFGNGINNGRAVLLSQDAGATWTDQTRDTASPTTGIHPDQHALAVDPANPLLFFEGSDGGVVRSSGKLTNASANCNPNLGAYSTTCTELLSAVPTQITALNKGLSTLQYQSVAVNPSTSTNLMGGTQDNGTWNGTINSISWPQTIYGDGGQSGYDSGNSSIRFTNFYSPYSDENFENGDPTAWVIVSGNFFDSTGAPKEASAFYLPEIADPAVPGHAVHRAPARLAHAGQRRRQGDPRGELPRVHDVRRAARLWRLRPARRSVRERWAGHLGRPDVDPVRNRPRRRLRRRRRQDDRRPLDPLGGNGHRPRVHLAERERARSLFGDLQADRHHVDRGAGAVRVGHHGRPDEREPGVDHIQRVQREHPGHAGPRVPGRLQPDDAHRDVDGHRQRHRPDRRPAGDGHCP